jgi:hypothetical protein
LKHIGDGCHSHAMSFLCRRQIGPSFGHGRPLGSEQRPVGDVLEVCGLNLKHDSLQCRIVGEVRRKESISRGAHRP